MSTDLREEVRERYAEAARTHADAGGCGCGDGGCCGDSAPSFGSGLYGVEDRSHVPRDAVSASLGCGNPSAVLGEIARVLRPGGRVGISDIVAEDRLTPEDRAARGSFVGCVAGALSETEYRRGLEEAGLVDVDIERTHQVADGMHSAIVRARKPA